jgi:hypothetical protein
MTKIFSALVIAASLPLLSVAQVTTAQIAGTLRDSSGAAMPGVQVSVSSESTGLSRSVVANSEGIFVMPNLLPGAYNVRVEHKGFKTFVREHLTLSAGERAVVNAVLEPGAVNEVVTVVARGEDVQSDSGTVGQLIDGSQVRNLALNGRNLIQMTMLAPGVVSTLDEFDRGNIAFGLTADFYINGTRSSSNLITIDGAYNADAGTNTTMTNNVSPDFVEEVKVARSGQGAEYGRNAGGQINYSTRRGTEEYHGGLREFFRNNELNARSFFAPQVEKLRLNHFGWNFGGPVYIPGISSPARKTLFVFGGQEYKRRIDGETRRVTLPTRAERAGIPATTTATYRYPDNFAVAELRGQPVSDPSRATADNPTGRNLMPLRYMTANGRAIMKVFDALESIAVSYTDQKISNNTTFQLANEDRRRQDLVRVDYLPTSANQFSFRYIYDVGNYKIPYETSSIPTWRMTRANRAPNMQLQWTRTFSSNSVNELSFSSTYLNLERQPYGELRLQSTYGMNIPELFGNESRVYGMPGLNVSGFTAIPRSRMNSHSPTVDFNVRDNFTHLRGKHQLKSGLLVVRNRKNERTNAPVIPSITFNTTGNQHSTGSSLLDALIGQYRQYDEADNDTWAFERFTQFEAYVADVWKVRPNLTIDAGLRGIWMQAPYDTRDAVSAFIPSRFDPAKAQRVVATGASAGEFVPGVGVPNNGIVRAGTEGIPRGIMDNHFRISPRLGVAWDPSGRGIWSFRAGAGVAYDRLPLLIYRAAQNPPFVRTVSLFDGNIDNPTGGRPSSGFPVQVQSQLLGVVPPATYNWNFGLQRKLPFSSLLDLNYVSTQGRHLLQRPDFNIVTPAVQYPNRTANLNSLRPYQGYTNIYLHESSAASNYHSLQVGITRRYSRALTYSVAYTWSKVLTNSSSVDSGPQDPNNYRAERSHATFDRNHVLVFSYVWRIPVFRDAKKWTGRVFGGWDLSGITQMQHGAWLTPSYNTAIGGRRPDRVGDVSYLDPRATRTLVGGNGVRTTGNFFFDPTPGTTFVSPPLADFGNSSPNVVRGPGRNNWDLSVFKEFPVRESVKMQLRGEFFNVFNHAGFRNPNMDASSAAYGTVSDAGPPRLVQIALKLLF